jgi:hypothetical protein
VVLVLLNLLLKLVQRNLLVLNDKVDLELLDAETNRNPLVGTPHKTIHLNGLDILEELIEVGLVV